MAQYSRSIVPHERYGVIPTLIMNDTVMRFSHSRGHFILMLEGNCSPHRLNVRTVTPDLTTLALHGCIAAATEDPWLAVVLQGASDMYPEFTAAHQNGTKHRNLHSGEIKRLTPIGSSA